MIGRGGASGDLARKLNFKRWYQRLASTSDQVRDWTFMNYGFLDLDDTFEAPELDAADEHNRLPIQLYHLLLSQAGLRGKDLLDIGSGRGGGASYAARYLEPASVTGVDYASSAVEFCKQTHAAIEGLEYFRGDAEMLPFDDARFDVVSNIEVSHCFGSMPSFLTNVHRVLKPGGSFVYTDFRDVHEMAGWRQEMADSGLELVWEREITANVLAAMELESKHVMVREFSAKNIPEDMRHAFEMFAGLQGSPILTSLKGGNAFYWAFHLVKPAPKRRTKAKKKVSRKTKRSTTAKT